jgi:hypothetical protein
MDVAEVVADPKPNSILRVPATPTSPQLRKRYKMEARGPIAYFSRVFRIPRYNNRGAD